MSGQALTGFFWVAVGIFAVAAGLCVLANVNPAKRHAGRAKMFRVLRACVVLTSALAVLYDARAALREWWNLSDAPLAAPPAGSSAEADLAAYQPVLD